MPVIRQLSLGIVAVLILSACATPEKSAPPPPKVYRTGMLKAVPGSTGDVFGSEVERVRILSDETMQAVEVSIPVPPDKIDQVEVISSSGNEVIQLREAEIEPSVNADGTDVTVYLPRNRKLQFRLRLIDNFPQNGG